MLDTVILTLPSHMFIINDPEAFTPTAFWALQGKFVRGIQSKQNPTKKELKQGIYKPRLTILSRFSITGSQESVLKIEVSLPKLMFGNNFNELRYKSFPAITSMLAATLAKMGITVAPDSLASAAVSIIHYSKNIKLTDGTTPYHYIKKIQEAGIPWSVDVNKTDFRNDGHSYKWHCNSYEIAFYDKIRDLEKARQSSKRAVEKDSTLQLHLLENFKTRKNLEYLRMEVRLNKRAKIKQLLKKLGIKADLTFHKLFKPAIAKKILLHYIDELESRRPVLLDYKTHNDKALLTDLIFNNPEFGPKQVMQLFGMKKALEIMNLREMQAMFPKNSARSWQRLIREINAVSLRAVSPFGEIRKQINIFKPL
jgi:hypothetical protein